MEHPGVIIGLAAMWVLFIAAWTIPAVRRRETHEVYASLTLSAFISLLFLVYSGAWDTRPVNSLVLPAITLQVTALALVAGAFHSLRSTGNPANSSEQTPVVVSSGVYGVMNHPMYLGVALWAASIGMGRYSPASATLAGLIVVLTVCASITEDAHNIRKFGEPYVEYTRRLPLQRACAMMRGPSGRKPTRT